LGCIGTALLATAVAAQEKSPTQKPGAGVKPAATRAYPAALLKPETLTTKAPEEFHVRFVTSKGPFTVKVTRAWAPNGADRFYNLVRNRFYDGASFFRVVQGFVVQFGLSAHPDVSKAWREARIQDDPVVQSNKRGFLTYAMAGANTRTTQLFINLVDNTRLDGMGFAPFGEVTSGMEIVEQLYSGYGDGAPRGNGPQQGLIQERGRDYLAKDFPLLDSIRTARIVPPMARSGAAKQPPAKNP
jgi:peptidyl-prolyl cis-trans isomerase A (cyclophilin A)